ncbi:MAG: tRNA lysidine(34) synthetase TilS [Ignavibacteriaceae bacterium]|nr:tRNA lysidine(34) synthetase TilS [Ignavibacteriaceae bacterium]
MKKEEEKALKYIDENGLIERDDKVLVALSGGPDSVFLLHFLLKFRKKFRIDVGAVHINHMIRGKAANEDEEFCRKLSVNLHIDFLSVRKNVRSLAKQHKISIEEAGRVVRYQEFEKALKQTGFNKIATAHNCSDNAETVLLNLIKGTGIKGISGIPPKRGNIIRPILCLKKDEILDYLNNYGIKFRIDESNLETDYERNFLRKKVIPLIRERLNPDFENALFHSSEIFAGFSVMLDSQIKEKIKGFAKVSKDGLNLNVGAINNADDEIKNYLIKAAVEGYFKIQLTFTDVKNIKALFEKRTGKSINLANNLTAGRERQFVIISSGVQDENFEPLSLAEGSKVKVNDKTLIVKPVEGIPEKFSGNRLKEYISADKLSGNFCLRRWKAGDKFSPLGLKGTKKISDFLNEQKIASSKKKEQLILTNKGRIVWVLGLRLDERFKITNNTKRIIELCLK